MGESINTLKVLVGNPERERPFGRPEPGCEKMSAEDLN
jgi:hypothetical protein